MQQNDRCFSVLSRCLSEDIVQLSEGLLRSAKEKLYPTCSFRKADGLHGVVIPSPMFKGDTTLLATKTLILGTSHLYRGVKLNIDTKHQISLHDELL